MSSMNTAQAAAKREQERLEREQRRRERMMGLFGTPGPSSPQRRAMQDEARVAAANESYRRQDEAAQRRSARIAAAKRDGTFDEIRSGYNKVQGQFMDEAGNIYSQSAYSPAQWAGITGASAPSSTPAEQTPRLASTSAVPSATFSAAKPIDAGSASFLPEEVAPQPASRLPVPASPVPKPDTSGARALVDARLADARKAYQNFNRRYKGSPFEGTKFFTGEEGQLKQAILDLEEQKRRVGSRLPQ